MKHKVIRVIDQEEDFEYAVLVVPEELANEIQTDIKRMAKDIYHWENYDKLEDKPYYDSLADYIYDKYDEYIDNTPIVLEIE